MSFLLFIETLKPFVEFFLPKKLHMILLDRFKNQVIMRVKQNIFTILLHVGFWALYFLLIIMLISSYLTVQQAILRIILNGFVMAFAFYFNALILVNQLLVKKKICRVLFECPGSCCCYHCLQIFTAKVFRKIGTEYVYSRTSWKTNDFQLCQSAHCGHGKYGFPTFAKQDNQRKGKTTTEDKPK